MMSRIFTTLSTKLGTSLLTKPQYQNGTISLLSNFLKPFSTAGVSPLMHQRIPLLSTPLTTKYESTNFLQPKKAFITEQIRTVTKFNLKNGRRRTVKAVIHRFFRLNWGIWVRTYSGRKSRLWKKTVKRRNRLLQHVFCNATQSRMLDTMVSKYWRKPKYYIEDPYEPYHIREEFYITRKKPWRPEGVDYE